MRRHLPLPKKLESVNNTSRVMLAGNALRRYRVLGDLMSSTREDCNRTFPNFITIVIVKYWYGSGI